ncbi:MFS transporter [Cryobacterium sp. TMT1-21]|uniref:MFS transporter n=1 Tax=unclassified Cryobacterium TaxID=2649013 RepID=UPI00106ABF0B|nr:MULTISPECIES: MFS transporter [unclassified Cryobacterium]TFC82382.1 MFS transporter [Cryobacterium sp. TmT2-59]TFD16384.1 MFS transporter [Cryobacterium sp. TMT1-21]TFD17697.1 MFS transporter [Cryobacterium sp. TMT4-10]TFD27974.1 MFS transporter [Cryobacterium sp. TMT2-23]TFD44000.1 MFS transporter [Cryobacterium sp. TMT2-10]
MNSRRSWLVFSVGSFAYLSAVLQRSSLGIAGVAATDRFGGSAALLSSLAVVQLVVYAAAQIPVGVLIDRYGPRVLVLTGTSLMAAGQVTLALAPSISIAVVGRILVGAGDAMIFISMIRLISSWFTGRSVPQLSQWLGNIGQLGQVLSAVPLAWVLHIWGWTPAFLSAASVALVALVVGIVVIRDQPAGTSDRLRPTSLGEALAQLKHSFKRPGTQLGFWSHYVTQSAGTVFTLLWGFPFMVYGLGYDPSLAAAMLMVLVGAGMVFGPVLGILTARYPLRRSNIVLGIVTVMAVAWAAVLLWPGQPPFWLIVLLLVALGVGGPGSLIGFDFARTFNPQRSHGSANGVVNVGGFTASFVMVYLVGLLLDLQDSWRVSGGAASDLYSLDSFRLAFSVQFLVVGIGVVFLLRTRTRTRSQLSREEGIEVAPLWVGLARAWRRRRRPE